MHNVRIDLVDKFQRVISRKLELKGYRRLKILHVPRQSDCRPEQRRLENKICPSAIDQAEEEEPLAILGGPDPGSDIDRLLDDGDQ